MIIMPTAIIAGTNFILTPKMLKFISSKGVLMFEKLLEKLDNYLKKKAQKDNKPCCHCKDGKGNCQKKQANKTE